MPDLSYFACLNKYYAGISGKTESGSGTDR